MTGGRVPRRRVLAACGTAVAGGLVGCVQYLPVDKGVPNDTGGSTIHVRPGGGFFNSGAEDDPLGSINRAVNLADPGDTVYVHPGEYVELVETSVGGDPENPLTLTGPANAVLKPPEGKESSALEINNSYTHLTGLTITGLHNADAPDDPNSYHQDKLISINSNADGPDDYLEGLVVSPHRLGNAGQALINSVQFKDSEIGGFKVIGPAGTKWILDDTEGHNGEIVYLGTAPDNRHERGYDTYDQTRNIRVHHIDNSEGHPHSELVDCKTGTRDITIEYCTDGGGSQEQEGGKQNSILLDGHRCTVRRCLIEGSEGPPIQIGPTHLKRDTLEAGWGAEPQTPLEQQMGTEHSIYHNALLDYGAAHRGAIAYFRMQEFPDRDTNPTPNDQHTVCGNVFETETAGEPGRSCQADVPTANGVGHLAGNSPWEGTPLTLEDMRDRIASIETEATIQSPRLTVGETVTVVVTVRNAGGEAGSTRLVLSAVGIDFPIAEARVEVPPGEQKRIELTTKPIPQAGEHALTLNGDPIGSVTVAENDD